MKGTDRKLRKEEGAIWEGLRKNFRRTRLAGKEHEIRVGALWIRQRRSFGEGICGLF